MDNEINKKTRLNNGTIQIDKMSSRANFFRGIFIRKLLLKFFFNFSFQ